MLRGLTNLLVIILVLLILSDYYLFAIPPLLTKIIAGIAVILFVIHLALKRKIK